MIFINMKIIILISRLFALSSIKMQGHKSGTFVIECDSRNDIFNPSMIKPVFYICLLTLRDGIYSIKICLN